MKPCARFLLAAMLAGAPLAAFAGTDTPQVPIHFQKGKSSAVVTGRLTARQDVDYRLEARAGQSMLVDFKPSNPSAYFNILPPGGEEAIFVGSTSGNRYEGDLPADGVYTIRVYLMRSAARRGESTKYRLEVGINGVPAAGAGR